MDFIKQMLCEDEGELSTMRVMSFVSLLTGCLIGVIGLFYTSDLSGLSILSGVFVGAAFGGKVGQKAFESKGGK